MRIGRLEFGIANGPSLWSYQTGVCGCKILDVGHFFITWRDKDCKCMACKQYTCECEK